MAIDKISETILEKVRLEAQEIVQDAETRALENINRATAQRDEKFGAEKDRLTREAEGEAARIMAQASIKARLELSAAKAEIVEDIITRVKKELGSSKASDAATINLISESISQLGAEKAVIYVSAADLEAVKKLAKDKSLAGKIIDVREYSCSGGIIAEDEKGDNRIDNTYEARLEKLLPQLLPEISKELFRPE